ncbi:hypothetical protein P3S67_005975 [Capsicum chacoense]
MDCVKLVLFSMLYTFLCQLVFSSPLPHLCPKHQAHALLLFKLMFTINPNASVCYNPTTLSWNKSTDCCSWKGIHCEETTGQVIELDLACSGLQGKFHSNSSLFQLSKLKRLYLYFDNFSGLLISANFGAQLRGVLPERVFHLSNLEHLELSYNSPTGPIPSNFKSKSLYSVDLKQNQLQGPIPKSLLDLQGLFSLRISQNNLSGQIASTMSELAVLDLNNNCLSGTINTTFTTENEFTIINLYGNKLQGKVPPSFINCRYLEFLDLGDNQLNDTFPSWLGGLPDLQILSLRSNKLYGPIKESRTDNFFAKIRVIDLSSNGFSGDLPVSLFEKFQAMKIVGENSGTRKYVADRYSIFYANTLIVTTKGLDLELPRVLPIEIIINLSRNSFEGYLPSIIGDLVRLRTLNYLIMLVSLTSLEVLNLSHNHLVGCIPKGKQFDTFDNSSYQGNDGLRGLPLSKDCGGDDGVPQASTPVELDEDLISWQAVLMCFGCGLVIGLSIVYIMLSIHYPSGFRGWL